MIIQLIDSHASTTKKASDPQTQTNQHPSPSPPNPKPQYIQATLVHSALQRPQIQNYSLSPHILPTSPNDPNPHLPATAPASKPKIQPRTRDPNPTYPGLGSNTLTHISSPRFQAPSTYGQTPAQSPRRHSPAAFLTEAAPARQRQLQISSTSASAPTTKTQPRRHSPLIS
eukprot:gi/632983387/ref/XP_007908622.1/ PREDICTED: extensin-like [Callorhinchus milii]